jgi:murein DD-endopeptidase MepM/ murein hydrolase activator NlpD
MRFTALGFVVASALGSLPCVVAATTDSSPPGLGASAADCRSQPLSVREGDNAFDLLRRAGIDARSFSNYLQRADARSRRALAAMHGGDTLQLCVQTTARGGQLVSVALQPRSARATAATSGAAGDPPPPLPFAAVTAQVLGVPPRPDAASTTTPRGVNPFAAVSAQVLSETRPAPAPTCHSQQLTVGAGDNAYALLKRGGIDARSFANWMRPATPSSRQALGRMHAGDVVVFCVSGAAPALQLTSVSVQTPRAAAVGVAAAPAPARLRTWVYAAGTPLQRTLQQRLADRALATAVLSYIRNRWHLPDHLPKGSALTLAQRADNRSLVYVDFNRGETHERAYPFVDASGHHFVLGDGGSGLRLLALAPPVRVAQVSSGWGWRTQPVLGGPEFHHGIDYAAPQGTPVYAAMDGVVDMQTWHGNYGRLVEIKHADGMLTRYGHLSAYANDLKLGRHVHRGELIGYVGHSGLSTGPHLYFELWEAGQRVDPAKSVLTVDTQLSDASRRQFLAYIGHLSS